eukprot:Selendium_serpulae@DN5758_c0_g1_i2.p1
MFVPAYGTHEYPFLASEILADRAVETKRDLITTGLEEELKVELCKARVAVPEALVAGAVGIQGSQFYLTLSCAGLSVNHLDITPNHAGIVFGIGNTAGIISGFFAVNVCGVFVDMFGTFTVSFILIGIHYVVGAVMWLLWAEAEQITINPHSAGPSVAVM